MTLIIAEAGVNHNGREDLALELVDVACESGADIIKFQTFKAENLATQSAEQAAYQALNTGKKESQLDMLKRLELSLEVHHKLADYCRTKGIEFLSTAFDLESLDFLTNELGLKRLKVPSGDLTNAPLLLAYARSGCDLIVSTGMATLAEVETALGVLAFGYQMTDSSLPSQTAFERAYGTPMAMQSLREKVTLLHCTTEYPTAPSEVNLRAMDTIFNAFHLQTGFSDHSRGIHVPIAAVARGAVVIEKHFTLSRRWKVLITRPR